WVRRARPRLPSGSGHPVKERRIGLAADRAHERRRAQAKGCAPAWAFERDGVQRFGSREDGDGCARLEGAGLEIREERLVLFGLLRDPVDGGVLARLQLAERNAGRTSLRRGGIDGVAVRTGLGM